MHRHFGGLWLMAAVIWGKGGVFSKRVFDGCPFWTVLALSMGELLAIKC
jgi:hypothetical protein